MGVCGLVLIASVLLPHNLGAFTSGRLPYSEGGILASPAALCCCAIWPQGHSPAASELAACSRSGIVMQKVLETDCWFVGRLLPPGNKRVYRKATMEREKGLLEGEAAARVVGYNRETGACPAVCCLVFWTGRQTHADLLAS